MSPLPRSRGPRAARGQSLVLAAFLMLVVTVAVFLTFAIGARVRRKIQLQAVADSTAYSLAVAEARAFNFYAWSNRALVAHNISILSVHAHQSYLSFYEDMLAATAKNFRRMSQQVTGIERDRLEYIADIYLDSDFNPKDGHGCVWRTIKGKRKCIVDADCVGNRECEYEDSRKRGAKFFHDVWHTKDSSNTCYRLVEGSRNHFRKVELLRAHQLGVESQLELMMTGERSDTMSSKDLELLEFSTRNRLGDRMYQNIPDKEHPWPNTSLAQNLARLTDRQLTAQQSAGRVTLRYYHAAVDNGLENNRHKDYDEILAGTRFPQWLVQRGFQNDTNWRRLGASARRVSQGVGTPSTRVTSSGTARMLKVGSLREDPGQDNAMDPLGKVWPPRYRDSAGAYALPRSGAELARAAHREGHDQIGFGESDGIAAEDHGVVESSFRLASGRVLFERTVIEPGRNTVWGDPHDYQLQDGKDNDDMPGSDGAHSHHVFHGDIMSVPGHGIGLGGCEGVGCEKKQRGVYRGHMRFKLAALRDEDDLWNLPRTMTLITRPVKERERGWPWDFHFKAELPRKVEFTTLEAKGDREARGTMAAFSGGLVYFHKPRNSGEEYREPPNLWNPFWRAKLHPVRKEDAVSATQDGHPPTYLMLLDLHRWPTVNY